MLMIRPVMVDDVVLEDSNVPESEPVYSTGTTYAKDAEVRGNVPATQHLVFRSVEAGNLNKPLSDPLWWLQVGPTNRYRMFDQTVGTQTTNAESVEVRLSTPGRVDSVALLNVAGASVQVQMTDATDGVVFDQTYSLVSSSGITDWWSYFFEPIERLTDLFVTGLPPYAGADVTVTVSDPGATVSVGTLVFGLSKNIGDAEMGASVGIQDYSRKDRDQFGNTIVVQRAFSKRGRFNVKVAAGEVDQTFNLLADYRAIPIVWVGATKYGVTLIYGFFRDFNIEIAYDTFSYCSLELEGLT